MSSIFGTANQVLMGSRYDQNLNLKKKKKKNHWDLDQLQKHFL